MTDITELDAFAADFSVYLLERRGENGISQEELAKISGVSVKTISGIENGKRTRLKQATISDLLLALDATLNRSRFEAFRGELTKRNLAAQSRAEAQNAEQDSSISTKRPVALKSWYAALPLSAFLIGIGYWLYEGPNAVDPAEPGATVRIDRPVYPQDIAAALENVDINTLNDMIGYGVSVTDVAKGLETTSLAFFKGAKGNLEADQWFVNILAQGLDPEARVDHKRYGSVSLFYSAFDAGNIEAAKTLLESGASPHGYQDLTGIRRDDPFFLFPAHAVSKADHITELDKITLLDVMFEQGVAFYEPVEISYDKNPYQNGDGGWISTKDELENLLKLTEERPVEAELGCTFERQRARCLAATQETGVNWCSIMDSIPAVMFVRDHSFQTNLVGVNVQDLISISDGRAYFFTTHLFGTYSVYGLLETTPDEDTFNIYQYGTPTFREPICELDDDIEMNSYCWRDFQVRKTSASTAMINGSYEAELLPSCG